MTVRTLTSLGLSIFTLALLFAGACGGGESGAPAALYEVRGVVKEVGGEGADARASIQHEAIPTFKDRKGKEVGMKPMTMAFGIDPSADRAALAQGTKVELVVEVDWDKRPSLLIKQAKALPADTALKL